MDNVLTSRQRLGGLLARIGREEIPWEEALSEYLLMRDDGKSWHTKAWKEKRKEFLKSMCEQCGSQKPPLVVQHLVHPRSFGQVLRSILAPEWKMFKEAFDSQYSEDLKDERATCPTCSSTNIKKLKTTAAWSCYNCGTKHAEPNLKRMLGTKGRIAFAKRKRDGDLKSIRWERFKERFTPDHGREVVITLIEESIDYLDFKHAVTFCKRCAFAWDKQGLRLCTSCRKEWHSLAFPCCRRCSIDMNWGNGYE